MSDHHSVQSSPDPDPRPPRRIVARPLFDADGLPRMDPIEPLTREAAREICRNWMRRKDRLIWEIWYPGFASWYRDLFRRASGEGA